MGNVFNAEGGEEPGSPRASDTDVANPYGFHGPGFEDSWGQSVRVSVQPIAVHADAGFFSPFTPPDHGPPRFASDTSKRGLGSRPPSKTPSMWAEDEDDDLDEAARPPEVAALRAEIERLQEEVRRLRGQGVSSARPPAAAQPTKLSLRCPRCEARFTHTHDASAPPRAHKGKWTVSKESAEFVAFPAELKDNLRKEKQRKIAQLVGEMRWVLDDDSDAAASGAWSCCKGTDPTGRCTS